MTNKYLKNRGYFDEPNREYVITSPILPSRWINYIGTNAFGGFIDHNGGFALCKEDPAFNRITRYIPQSPSSSVNGAACYIREKTKDGYKLFSPYYTPVLFPLDSWECRVGLSYSKFICSRDDLHISITVFVPGNNPRLIHHYKITNSSESEKSIDLIPVVEYSHFDALKNITNRDWVGQTMQSKLIKGPDNMKLLTQAAYMKKDTAFNFFHSSKGFTSFETSRNMFLGNHSYGTWQTPQSLFSEEFSNTEALGDENIAALLISLNSLSPGQSVELVTQLGQTGNPESEWKNISHYMDIKQVNNALADLQTNWETQLYRMQVLTPDKDFTAMTNILLPRQCNVTADWSRDLSSFQTGFGDRGMGYRDTCQDITGITALTPETAKQILGKLASMQCPDGHAMHQFSRLTMEAFEGDSREHTDRPSFYSDDHLWLIIAAANYLKESNDMGFLTTKFPFYDKHVQIEDRESAPLLEHLERALAFTHANTGKHSLPLLGFADWNDTVNLPSGSESVFSACLYGKALDEIRELYEYLGNSKKAEEYRNLYKQMKEIVNQTAWDGEWYISYFDENGNAIGSSANKYGQIFAHVQAWAIISGFADSDRAQQTLESVKKMLDTPYGIKLSFPGYSGYDPSLGGVSTYPPGAKENGGIFCHAHAWMIIAEALCGNGDRAYELFCKTNPLDKNGVIDTYEMEPYCMSQNILGDEHPHAGKARNSWLTGTAAWTYRAASEYIIGIIPGYRKFTIDPCIPRNWENVHVTRQIRGKMYDIDISNPGHIEKGKSSVLDPNKQKHQVIMKKEETL